MKIYTIFFYNTSNSFFQDSHQGLFLLPNKFCTSAETASPYLENGLFRLRSNDNPLQIYTLFYKEQRNFILFLSISKKDS
ncbi:hypothetical protein C7120_03645 [Prevotella sp. oral taxon 376]|nr:hypothetical protein C7120_03645 [Prevotella sp. oral taxon 376]